MNVPILMYHQVSPRPSATYRKYVLTTAALAAQMRWLALAGHVPISFDQFWAARRGLAVLPRRAVVITFDDGYQDVLLHAVPILQAHGFPAIIYLVAGLMGQPAAWLAGGGRGMPLMDWAGARELAAAGIQCGGHTLTHPHLAELDPAESRRELLESRLLLEDRLGLAVPHLAYPYGSYNESVRSQAAECGYETACSVHQGLSDANDDPLALHRVPVNGTETLLDFISRLYTTLPLRDAMRRTAARRLRPMRAGGAGRPRS
jgi:peptidoglycan/xylan/chitin deacetylase (PgdA/CDA1 family)